MHLFHIQTNFLLLLDSANKNVTIRSTGHESRGLRQDFLFFFSFVFLFKATGACVHRRLLAINYPMRWGEGGRLQKKINAFRVRSAIHSDR